MTDTRPNNTVARRTKKVSPTTTTATTANTTDAAPAPVTAPAAPATNPYLHALPTGAHPTTREDLFRSFAALRYGTVTPPTTNEEIIEWLASHGEMNLYGSLHEILTELQWTEAAATRSVEAGSRKEDNGVPVEDHAADEMGYRLFLHADRQLPRLGKEVEYPHLGFMTRLLFGRKSMKRYLRERVRVGPGDGDTDESSIDGDAEQAFRIAATFFLAPLSGAGRMLLQAAALVVESEELDRRFVGGSGGGVGKGTGSGESAPAITPAAERLTLPERRTASGAFEWPYDETLTEPEGHALRAFRAWTQAQSDPIKRRELDVRELIGDYLYDYRDGSDRRETFREHWGLTEGEHAAMQTVADLWQRLATERGEFDARREGEGAGEASETEGAR